MRIFAISDLHLPGADKKAMDIFGPHWANHFERIREDWLARVTPEDTVLIPGDISWAMTLTEARQDLDALLALPGRKVLLRGNHDFWWDSISRVREYLLPGNAALQNDAIVCGDTVICGTRGWNCPGRNDFTAHDEHIYQREAVRLRLSLDTARRKMPGVTPRVMLHYPPFNEKKQPSLFTALFWEYGVRQVIYGHIHGRSPTPYEGWLDGVHYRLVSCDHLNFQLLEWPEVDAAGQAYPFE